MEYHKIKYPIILVRDLQQCVLDNYTSEKTETYMNNTAPCQTEEGRQAFRAGMIYATLLIPTQCYQFGNVMIADDEIEDYLKENTK